MKLFVFIIISFSLLLSCKNSHTPLFKKDHSSEKENNNNLFVFVGELIQCQVLPQEEGSMDAAFKAKFKILQMVYGEYASDTIEFIAYDHYGIPQFSKYKNSLMFVSKHDDKYFHEKYQFHDVYRAKNGRWAGTVWCADDDPPLFPRPEKIDFEENVNFPAIHKDVFGDDEDFPCGEPYYRLAGDKKIPVYGNYIEELFLEKKDGVLAARGLFEDTSHATGLVYKDVEMADVTRKEPNIEDVKFKKCYESLLQSILRNKLEDFKKLSASILTIKDSIIYTNNLSDSSFKDLFREKMLRKYNQLLAPGDRWTKNDSTNLIVKEIKMYISEYEKNGDKILIMGYNFDNRWSKKIVLQFNKINSQYKFFGYDSIKFPLKTFHSVSYFVP